MANVQPPTFASVLRRYRRTAGLTQLALAERAGIGVNTISALERDVRHTPHAETLALLADALELAPADRAYFEAIARGYATDQRLTLSGLVPARRPPETTSALWRLPLVGRTYELALLARHLAGEGPPILVLAGEPGIGRTRLLRESCEQAQASGWTVLEGAAPGAAVRSPMPPCSPP
jgi:transcriptional regulator with XRE-family HTH domain